MSMKENDVFASRYLLERLLGRGGFSEVWLALDQKTDAEVALKIYAPAGGLDEEGLQMFVHEFTTVMNINHKNLLHPMYFDDWERMPYLILPYCRGGSVKSRIGNLGEEDAWRMLRDVASGLAELHGMEPPIVHQDIKPDNIMQGTGGRYLITDFGVSTRLRSTLRRSVSQSEDYKSAGTMAYMAPERFGRKNSPVIANDIFSLGATMYEMLTGDVPFGNLGGVAMANGAVVPELQCDCSEQLKTVIERCLSKEPWDRPTAEELEQWAQTGLTGGIIVFNKPKGDEEQKVAVAAVASGSAVKGTVSQSKAAEAGAQAGPATEGKKSNNKMIIIIAACIVVLALIGFFVFGGQGQKPATDKATLVAEAPGEVQEEVADVVEPVAPAIEGAGNAQPAVAPSQTTNNAVASAAPAPTPATNPSATTPSKANNNVKSTEVATTTGSLRVASNPAGADVYIDGNLVGTSPGVFADLAAGTYQIEVRMSGYNSQTATANVTAGSESSVSLSMQAAQVAVTAINGHEFVDLGLSVKWASTNIGASSPTDYGTYFAWGETVNKSSYKKNNSATHKKGIGDVAGNSNYDAARANWGGSWRLPTSAEVQELLEKCTWKWSTQNGIRGYLVTSKSNGNSIFLPAAGRRQDDEHGYLGERGRYWCSTPSNENDRAGSLDFSSAEHKIYWGYRYNGDTVRPVSE